MTKHFNDAVATIGLLPPDQQDEAARLLRAFVGSDDALEDVDPAHVEGILAGLNELRQGQIATEAEVEAAFKRFGERIH